MSELQAILAALQGGGHAALLACCYFIYRASERLARIEKALDQYMREREGGR